MPVHCSPWFELDENPHKATLINLDESKGSELLGSALARDLQITLENLISWCELWLVDAGNRQSANY